MYRVAARLSPARAPDLERFALGSELFPHRVVRNDVGAAISAVSVQSFGSSPVRLRVTVTSAPVTGRKAESATRTPIIANIIVRATGSVLPASGRVPFCACEFGEQAEDNAATGLRVGWVCPPAQLTDQFNAFLGHVGAWAPRPAQVGTAEMLADVDAVAAARQMMCVGLKRRLDHLYTGLLALRQDGLPVEVVPPMGAMYISVRFGAPVKHGAGPLNSTEAIRRYLLEHAGLAAVPFEAFGFDGEPGWFRLSVGSVPETAIGALLVRLRSALKQL